MLILDLEADYEESMNNRRNEEPDVYLIPDLMQECVTNTRGMGLSWVHLPGSRVGNSSPDGLGVGPRDSEKENGKRIRHGCALKSRLTFSKRSCWKKWDFDSG